MNRTLGSFLRPAAMAPAPQQRMQFNPSYGKFTPRSIELSQMTAPQQQTMGGAGPLSAFLFAAPGTSLDSLKIPPMSLDELTGQGFSGQIADRANSIFGKVKGKL